MMFTPRLTRQSRLAILLVLAATLAVAQTSVKPTVTPANVDPQLTALGQSASIDWTNGRITATGMGVSSAGLTEAQARVRARGAAIADAQRLLTSAVWGLQVNSETVVRNYQLESDTIKTQVEGFLRGAQVVAESDKLDRQSDGSFIYSIQVSAPLYARGNDYGGESLIQILQPFIAKPKSNSLPSPFIEALRAGKRALEFIGRGVPIKASSLSLNAVGSGFQPCLVPKIVSEDGTVIFGNLTTLPAKAVSEGVVAYARDPQAAAASGRLGNDETTSELDAKRATGTAKCDLVIDQEASKALSERNKETGLLDELNIVITF